MRLDATTPRPPTAAEPEQEELLNRAIHPSAKYEGPSTLGGCVLGVGFLLVLVVCAFLNVAFVELPLRFLHHLRLLGDKPWRAIERVVEGWFFAMFAGLIEMVAGVQINMTADPAEDPAMAFPEHARVLLISNHRTEVDWLFFWNLGLRFGCHDRVRVMMKAVIRHAPGVGWAMLLLNFPYVKRDWATDQARITKLMTAYSQFSAGVWLAMFPEGTALYDKSLAQSQEFAQGRDEPRWNYVLVPRVKGFELCVQELDPDFIVDLTVAYPELVQGVRPSPIRIARGQFPAQVDMHVQRFHRSEFAGHKGAMGQWLKDRFADKEELLQSYYENDACFVDKKPICEQASVALPVCIGVAFNAFMLTLAGFWLLVLPLTTCSYLACCTAFCVLKTRRFGAGDAKH